ncbi:hypothetical protein WR25_19002 [Diploscapter pachys]|uniref:DNA methyltransferase 1-associated protein 1 n=1 Tax=Diploscapter pachys TaxID=2018661 RepID=A0A2A2KFW0_9BILA|nr:hypothetical protein WR25_19002 [Diploscapter pachys]
MHRELFNLISMEVGSSHLSSVLPIEQHKTYHNPKIKLGLKEVRRYKWVPFVNEARSDGLQLHHWQRVDRIDPTQPYPFARFNKVIKIPDFTDEEYGKHLKSAKWSLNETRYLFEVCRQFDIRWPIVHDRYDMKKFGVMRSMEDMKERFYSILNELARLKDPSAELVNYDADNERRRKEQLHKQWNRTKEQLEEEEMLMNELKRIETRKKEREKKAQDLQKLINMADAPVSPSLSGVAMSPALSKKKTSQFKKAGSLLGAVSSNALLNSLDVCSSSSLRFPEFKSSGPHLRSQEMKLPTNVGQKKLKNIETVLQQCKMG